jgi:uncharacterized protein YggE
MKSFPWALFLTALTLTGHAQTKNFLDLPYLEVKGSADTLITPDEIFIKIVLSEKDTKDKIPLEEQERKMVAAFASIGIDTQKDLVIEDMLSNYKYYLLKNKDIIKSKEYELKVSNSATASNVFIRLEDLGISNASIDRVDHSAMESIRNEIRMKAVANAKTIALALTKPLNQTVGSALYIAEINNSSTAGRVRGLNAKVSKFWSDGEDKSPPIIEFQKIKLTLDVQVDFLLK